MLVDVSMGKTVAPVQAIVHDYASGQLASGDKQGEKEQQRNAALGSGSGTSSL